MFYFRRKTYFREAFRGLGAQIRLSLAASTQFRANYLLSFMSVGVSCWVEVALWSAVLNRRGQVQGYGFEDLLVYLILANITGMIRVNWDSVLQFSEEVRSGAVARHLLKPIPLFHVFTGDWIARKLPIVMGAIPVFLLVRWLYPFTFHPSGVRVLLYLVFVALAVWMSAEIYFLIWLAAFWVEENSGVAIGFNVLGWGFLGVAFPLSFYPMWVQRVLDATPLPYLVYYPVMTLMGRMPAQLVVLRLVTAVFMGFALRYLRRAVQRLAEIRLQTLGG